MSSTTITCGCTRPSAMSPPRSNLKAEKKRSLPHATARWSKPEKGGRRNGKPLARPPLANPPTHPGIKRPSSLNQANVPKAFFQFRLNQYTFLLTLEYRHAARDPAVPQG